MANGGRDELWQRLWRRKQMEEEPKGTTFHLDEHVNQLIAQGYAPDLHAKCPGSPLAVKSKSKRSAAMPVDTL